MTYATVQEKALEELKDSQREIIEFNEAIDRLLDNPDFKRVVLDGYFKEEAIKLVIMKAEEGYKDPEGQAEITKRIDAIGEFNKFLKVQKSKANQAQFRVQEAEEALEYIRQNPEEADLEVEHDDAYTA